MIILALPSYMYLTFFRLASLMDSRLLPATTRTTNCFLYIKQIIGTVFFFLEASKQTFAYTHWPTWKYRNDITAIVTLSGVETILRSQPHCPLNTKLSKTLEEGLLRERTREIDFLSLLIRERLWRARDWVLWWFVCFGESAKPPPKESVLEGTLTKSGRVKKGPPQGFWIFKIFIYMFEYCAFYVFLFLMVIHAFKIAFYVYYSSKGKERNTN